MMKKLHNAKASYIFNIVAIILFIGLFIIYLHFQRTKDDIIKTSFNSNIEYTTDITNNIIQNLRQYTKNKNLYESLKDDTKTIDLIDDYLRLFITKKYRYIYVVDKPNPEKDDYRFLLDGSKILEDKSDFGELYTPIELDKWDKVYKTKKPLYFEHKDESGLWVTFINPMIVDDKIIALIVVDFSAKEFDVLEYILHELGSSFRIGFSFFTFIFFIIIWFSFFDLKRQREKEKIQEELKNLNMKLFHEKAKVENINKELERKVYQEVKKSRTKDKQLLQQSRLAQMGEMISMIAHQWRQPLAAISSTSAGILLKARKDKLTNEIAIELSNDVLGYTKHLSSTIDDFREFFKTNNKKTQTSYRELVNSVSGIIETLLMDKNIKLIRDLDCDTKFYTHTNELKQVILNLIKNAEDALLD
ncbi:MAG: HAMP domain-containing histidine kinase, partial [Epsilonproteobacteria bacterium]|nr:HAMP domain-containing histidine kinase [Campylobacterota bacterium]